MKLLNAVAAILCVGASAAFAADSPDVKHFTGFSNNVEVYAIRDKDTKMSGSLFKDATKTSAFKQDMLEKEYPASVNCFLMRYNFKLFLIDAGNFDLKGSLVTKLASINVRPKNVDYILLTHMHPDHIGGLIDKDGAAVFPNAKVYVTYEEWKHWNPIIAKQKPEDMLKKLKEFREGKSKNKNLDSEVLLWFFREAYNGKVQTLNFGEPVVPGLYAVKAVGHTPGHCYYRQGKIRFVGDVVHAVDLQIEHPEYSASFDNDPVLAYKTRVSFLETMSKDGNYVFGAHIPFPGRGDVHKEVGGYLFVPYKDKK